MCEGPNEREIINILLHNNCLKFTEDDLIGLTPYHARQIKTSAQVRTELNIYPGRVKILRIGDKQSDTFFIPTEYTNKISSVEKYCTKPELEMLLILAEEKGKGLRKNKIHHKTQGFCQKTHCLRQKKIRQQHILLHRILRQ